jgi:asparagine synthase (glutamine-hydrolysing)
VAAVAATELARTGRRLTTVSYVFDELPTCDERRYMDPMVRRFGLDARRFTGDDAWPLSNLARWPVNPSSPMEGLYRELRTRSYAAAREAGACVLLTGEHGDAMYPGGEQWLADLLREGRYGASLMELGAHILLHGVRRWPAWYGLRAPLGALARSRGWRREAPLPGTVVPPWLTPYAAGLVTASAPGTTRLARARRAAQHAWALDAATSRGNAAEQVHAAKAGVEVRWPFRDRRLVEFVLGIPAHQLYRPGESKRIMRRAMRGHLPDEIRLRRRPTSLRELFDRGIAEALPALERTLALPDATWPRYVDARWIAKVVPGRLRKGVDGAEAVVPWQCAVMGLWERGRVDEGGLFRKEMDCV